MQQRFNPLSKTIMGLIVLCLLSTGCDRHDQAPPPPVPVPEVSFITVSAQKTPLTTQLPGRTKACRVAQIRPRVNGLVQKRLFAEGSDVKAGQLLYQIDPAPFQAMVDSAAANLTASQKTADRSRAALAMGVAGVARQKATLALARINAQRFEDLVRVNAVSIIQRDQAVTESKVAQASLEAAQAQLESDKQAVAVARAGIEQAEAALQTARINLAYCRITAPISGRIGQSNVTEGAIVMAYQPVPMAIIQQLDPIYVDVPQSIVELQRLQRSTEKGLVNQEGKNQKTVKVILEDGTTYLQDGTLQFSDVSVDPTTGSVILRVLFPNPDSFLLPGMFVRAIIQEGIDDHAILIPQQAVSRDHKGAPFALIVDAQSRVELRRLTLDRTIKDKWLVSAGLAAGDRVIVEGRQRLRPGTPVTAVLFNRAAPAAQTLSQERKDGGA